jgi:hypothetical protein
MLAPHNVTSTLRMMSDAQLAQYAQMHQNDPYIFPLAFQESQDRKNMRAQQMAKMSGQAQPPVVQQDLAQMMPRRPMPQGMPQGIPQGAPQAPQQAAPQLPEEQGIGTLPADNLQKMAGGGITGEHHFGDGGGAYNYTALTKADLPTKPSASEVNEYTKQIQEEAERRAAPEQVKTAALFDPYIQKLQAKQADIEDRKATNTQMALLQAGLGMLGGTSPYAFQNIAAGGKEGVAAYVSGKKAIQDSQDALDHSQFLAEQAKNAALKGDVHDQIALQNAALSSMMAGKHLDLAGISALSTSQAEAGELAAKKEENEIKGIEANAKKDYYASEAEYNRSRIPSQQDKDALKAQHMAETESAAANVALKKAQGMYMPGTEMYDKYEKAMYENSKKYYSKYNLAIPPEPTPTFNPANVQDAGFHWPSWLGGSPAPAPAATAAPVATPVGVPLPAGVPGAMTNNGPLPPGMNPNNPKGIKFLGFEQ